MEALHKLCPDCAAEFQSWATHCSDCGAELRWAPTLPAERSAPLPRTRELTCVRITDASGARELAEALQSAGVPSRVDSYPPDSPLDSGATDLLGVRGSCAPRVGVYVRPREAEAARAIDAELIARRTPELATVVESAPDENACPACGAALDPSAPSCGACGLSFPAQ